MKFSTSMRPELSWLAEWQARFPERYPLSELTIEWFYRQRWDLRKTPLVVRGLLTDVGLGTFAAGVISARVRTRSILTRILGIPSLKSSDCFISRATFLPLCNLTTQRWKTSICSLSVSLTCHNLTTSGGLEASSSSARPMNFISYTQCPLPTFFQASSTRLNLGDN